MTKMLTKEQFRAQFKTRCLFAPEVFELLTLESVLHGYQIFRALNRLFLFDHEDGHYYGS